MRHGGGGGDDGDDDNNDENIVGVGIASLASSEILFVSVLLSHFAFVFVLYSPFQSIHSLSRECGKKQFLIDDA